MKSDLELVAEAKEGNSKSFSELVNRHQRSLLRLSMRMTKEQSAAEDVVQESFIKAYQKLGTFEGRASFKSWLYQIALNTARNRFRRKVGERDFDTVNVDDVPVSVDPGAETGMLRADVRRLIQIEIDRLPDRQRMALTLRIFEDMSFKEIAEIMACPYDTAKANYRHALLKLKDRIEVIESQEGLRGDLSPLLEFSSVAGEMEF